MLLFGVLFLHVSALRREAGTVGDNSRVENNVKRKQMTESESFSAPHVQVILFFTEALRRISLIVLGQGNPTRGKCRGHLAGLASWGALDHYSIPLQRAQLKNGIFLSA